MPKDNNLFSITLILLLFLLSITSTTSTTNQTKPIQTITQNFAQVIDAATAAYITTNRWTQALRNFGVPFNVPMCINPPSFPPTFDYSNNKMMMCVEEETNHPWELVHELAAQLLMEQINTRYRRNIGYEIIKLNTTVKGYFTTMKESVDYGPCQVAITSTNYDLNRATQVRFQCMYGQSSYGYLYTGLDSDSISILTVNDLNQTGVILATYGNTIYDVYATRHFSAATIVRVNSGWVEVFRLAERKQVHVIVAEATDIRNWLSKNSENCMNCTHRLFGDPFSYSSFITNNIISGTTSLQSISLLSIAALLLFYLCSN